MYLRFLLALALLVSGLWLAASQARSADAVPARAVRAFARSPLGGATLFADVRREDHVPR